MFCSKQVMIGASKNIWGFDPRSIGGCQLWLDAADSNTVTGTTSVTAWRDKSINGYVANSFVNSVANPSWVSNVQNGNGVIQYTAGNGSSIANFVLAQTMSIFKVYYPINQSTGSPFIEHGPNENSESGFYFHAQSGNNFAINSGTGQIYVNFGTTSVSNTWQMIEGINPDPANGNTMAFYVNGTTRASGSTQSGTTTVTKTLYINGRAGTSSVSYNTYLAELIIYNIAVTTAQRQQVEGYLTHKWGLTAYYSPTTPLSISGCQLWLDGADPAATGVQPANNAAVSIWVDKSGNGRNATVVTTPLAKSAATYSTTFRALNFSDSNRAYVTTYIANPVNETVFVVFNNPSPNGNNFSLINSQLGGRALGTAWANAADAGTRVAYLNNDVAWSTAVTPAQSYTAGTTSILTGQVSNSTTQLIALNGSNFVSGAFTAGSGFSNNTFTYLGWNANSGFAGAGNPTMYYYIGYAMEIIFYNSILNTTQRQQIEEYLSKKWGLTTIYPTLPITHPYYSLKPCLRVFQPTDIAGCKLWLDGADLSSMTLSGSSVTQWRDKSVNGYNALPNAGGSAITMGTLNGVPAITFPAASTAAFLLGSSLTVGSGGYSVFFVANQTGFGSGGTRIYAANGGGIQSAMNDTPPRILTLYNGSSITSTFTVISNVPFMYSYTISSSASGLWKNGISAGTAGGSTTSITNFYIGNYSEASSLYAFTGQMGEFLIYNTALTTSQRQQVEGYLAHKWGLTSSLFTPLTIPGCQLWLDAADSSTITYGTGSSVASWRDKANGYAVANSSAAYRPVYSQGTIRFNGITSTSFLDIPTLTIGSSAFSIFFVMQNTGPASGNAYAPHFFWPLSGNGSGALSMTGWLNTNIQGINANIVSTLLKNQYYIISYTFGVTTNFEQLYANGISIGTYQKSSGYSASLYRIGAINTASTETSLDGNIGEILVYNTALTTSQRQRIEGYLSQKWNLGVSSTNPSTHPFYMIPSSTVTRPNFKELAYTGNDFNAYFAKYSPDGSVLWALRWVSTGGITFNDSATDSSGNVYVTGLYVNSSLLMYDTKGLLVKTLANSGGYDGFVAKYSSSGILLWTARHVGPGNNGYPTGVAVDSSGNVYAGGTWDGASVTLFSADEASSNTFGTTGGQTDGYIVKYNSSGIVQWSAKVVCTSYDQGGMSLKTDSSGNVYSVGINVLAAPTFYNANGTVGGSLLWGGTSEGMWLAKWNSSGTFQWALRFVTGDLNTGAGALSIDSSGNLYVSSAYDSTLTLKNTGDATAATMTNSGSYDAFIVKYSSAGSYIWNARIGGTGSTQEIANAIDGSGNVYVMGLYTGTLIVYTSGEASNTTLTNSGSYDHFIAKYTSAGVLVWATRIGSSGSEYNKGISVDLAGNVYTHGGHSATVTFFNVGGGIGGTLSNVGVDGYLAKYTTNGTFVWAALFGGPVTELSMRSITDPEGNIYLGGIYNSSPLTLNGV